MGAEERSVVSFRLSLACFNDIVPFLFAMKKPRSLQELEPPKSEKSISFENSG